MPSDFMHLIGVEDVRNAGHNMRQAAEQFSQSVGSLEHVLEMHYRKLDELVVRMEEAAEKIKAAAS